MAAEHAAGPVEERLRALARRYELDREQTARLRALLRLLAHDPLAPTAVQDESRVVDDHLADSLVALELDELRGARFVADLGAGAGLPGLPLAIAMPAARFALIESSGRKSRFIERAIDACGTQNARVVSARAEAWSEGQGAADAVTARAVGPLDVVAEYAAPLLRVGGVLIVWRGRRDLDGERAAARAASLLGLGVGEARPVVPYPKAQHRHLYVMEKVAETPSRFPRRPGMAAKRPLGAMATRPSSDRARR